MSQTQEAARPDGKRHLFSFCGSYFALWWKWRGWLMSLLLMPTCSVQTPPLKRRTHLAHLQTLDKKSRFLACYLLRVSTMWGWDGHSVESPPGSPSGSLTGTTSKIVPKTPVRIIFVLRRPRRDNTRIQTMMGICTTCTYGTILGPRDGPCLFSDSLWVLYAHHPLPSATVTSVSAFSQVSCQDTF